MKLMVCTPQGCDASVLLDDTPTMAGEKNAMGNMNSLRGYEVVDAIKSRVEAACRATVSCADVVALAARDSVSLVSATGYLFPLAIRLRLPRKTDGCRMPCSSGGRPGR